MLRNCALYVCLAQSVSFQIPSQHIKYDARVFSSMLFLFCCSWNKTMAHLSDRNSFWRMSRKPRSCITVDNQVRRCMGKDHREGDQILALGTAHDR